MIWLLLLLFFPLQADPHPPLSFEAPSPLALEPENRELIDPAIWNRQAFEERRLPWKLILVSTMGAGLAFGLWCYLLKRTRTPQEPKSWLQEKMHALKKRSLSEEERFIALIDLIREYVAKVYAVHFPQMTSEEFFHLLSQHPHLQDDLGEELIAFLAQADGVKFAKRAPVGVEVLCKECLSLRNNHERTSN